jgi:hypothetical protein
LRVHVICLFFFKTKNWFLRKCCAIGRVCVYLFLMRVCSRFTGICELKLNNRQLSFFLLL